MRSKGERELKTRWSRRMRESSNRRQAEVAKGQQLMLKRSGFRFYVSVPPGRRVRGEKVHEGSPTTW